MASISIITATFNARSNLVFLIESLRKQTDQDFEWVVSDGGSTDGTQALIGEIDDLNVVLDSRKDFGIYDALNRGIQVSNGDYYLVLGADDCLYSDAIENFRKYLVDADNKNWDIVCASIMADRKVLQPKSGFGWLYGLRGESSGHSVGLLINKKLHEIYGFYSKRYPICADQKFVLSAIYGGATVTRLNFVSGVYGTSGFSSEDILGSLTEGFRVKVEVGHNFTAQYLLLTFRLIKNFLRISS